MVTHRSFEIGQRIFTKIHGYPPWPGIICRVFQNSNGATAIYSVYLYEIQLYVNVTAPEMCDYQEYVNQNKDYLTSLILLADAIKSCMQHYNVDSASADGGAPLPNNFGHRLDELNGRDDVEIGRVTEGKVSKEDRDSIIPFSNRLQSLRCEIELRKCDFRIKRNLPVDGVRNSSCIQAMKALDRILELPLNEYVLKKCPDIVMTVLHLRMYTGNVNGWHHMTPEGKRNFRINARKIRKRAYAVYQVFRKIFKVPTEVSFTRIYHLELKRFRQ